MKFEEALHHLRIGEKIKRGHWKLTYIFFKGDHLRMSQGFRKDDWPYVLRGQDILAEDWIIYIDKYNMDD